jgi:two-component system phosphate regulon sensor histidine kinase PhoR
MHSKNIRWLIALLTIATCGILVIQTYWVMRAYTISREQLERDVKEAMSEVVTQLEKQEELNFMCNKLLVPIEITSPVLPPQLAADPEPATAPKPPKAPIAPKLPRQAVILPAKVSQQLSFVINGIESEGNTIHEKTTTVTVPGCLPSTPGPESFMTNTSKEIAVYPTTVSKQTSFTINDEHSDGTGGESKTITIVDIDSNSTANETDDQNQVKKSMIKIEHSQSHQTIKGKKKNFSNVYIYKDSVTSLNKKAGALKNVLDKLVFELEDKKPDITRRVQYNILTGLLEEAFNKRNIESPYSTGVLNIEMDKSMTEPYHTYMAQLFPNDIFSQKSFLWVDLHQPAMQVIKGMWVSLGISLFFALFIIGVFYLSVKTILNQKKLSNMKNDFINNMTHELKTPIATISIATDAMNIDTNRDRVSHYTHVIKEENARMNRHIEQVLQMAILEKKELELDKVAIEMHDLIHKVARSFNLPLEAKQGQIHFKLNASHSIIEADPYHMANVLNNLLDNAIKYSVNAPDITILSSNHDDNLTITVSDKGKGMSKAVQKHIFDKFYRVSSGNIHDVKGFGLGLSYVKTIVEAHKGTIAVSGAENEGSNFTVQLKTLH